MTNEEKQYEVIMPKPGTERCECGYEGPAVFFEWVNGECLCLGCLKIHLEKLQPKPEETELEEIKKTKKI